MSAGQYDWGSGFNPTQYKNMWQSNWPGMVDMRQPGQTWAGDILPSPGVFPKKKMANMNDWLTSRLLMNPYTQNEQSVNASVDLLRQRGLEGQQQADQTAAQNAARMGSTYSGVNADQQMQRQDKFAGDIAQQENKLRQEAVERDRDRLLQAMRVAMNRELANKAAGSSAGMALTGGSTGGGGMSG